MSTVTRRLGSTPPPPHFLTWQTVKQVKSRIGRTDGTGGSVLGLVQGSGGSPGSQERSTRCPGLYFSRKSRPRRSNPKEKCSLYKDVLTASFITVRTVQKNSRELIKAPGSESGHCHRKGNMLVKMTRMCHDVTSYANSHGTSCRLVNV